MSPTLHIFYRIVDDAGAEIPNHPLCDGAAISFEIYHAQIGDHVENPRTWFDNSVGCVVLEGKWLIVDRKWSEHSGATHDGDDTNFYLMIYLKKP